MTNHPSSTRIQIAPTHGEGVVNSKLPVDDYYIDANGVVTSAIANNKIRRLVSKLNEQTGKMELDWVDNPPELHAAPSLTPEVANYLHQLAGFIEKKYGHRVDIEAVWNPDSNEVNLVQVRAIPEASRKGLEPSAISPEAIAKEKLKEVKAQQVITPEVNKAILIVDEKQLSFENDIVTALNNYPQRNNILNNYKTSTSEPDQTAASNQAVIVTTKAPSTGHEAGQFNSYAVPVLCVDLKKMEELKRQLKDGEFLVVDPQHAKIYTLPKDRAEQVKQMLAQGATIGECVQALTESGFLAKGIHASALNPQATLQHYEFKKTGPAKLHEGNVLQILGKEKLGDLIIAAQGSGDKAEESTDKLFSIAYKAMEYATKQDRERTNEKGEKLLNALEELPKLQFGKDNHECKKALSDAMYSINKAAEKGIISKDLFRHC